MDAQQNYALDTSNASMSMDEQANEEEQKARQCFNDGKFNDAISYYKQSMALIQESDKNSKAVLYGNIAECFLRLNNFPKALENAEKSLGYDQSCTKSFVRCGRALSGMRKYDEAIQMFLGGIDVVNGENSFYSISRILYYLCIAGSKLRIFEFRCKCNIQSGHWVHAAHMLLVDKNWEASCVAWTFVSEDEKLRGTYTLRPFYKIPIPQIHTWAMTFFHFLLRNGSKLSSLTDGLNENYIHAYFEMMLHSDDEMEESIIQKVKESAQQNYNLLKATNRSGANIIHLLLQGSSHSSKRQLYLCDILFSEFKIEPLLLQRDQKGNLAISYVNPTHKDLFQRLRNEMEKQGIKVDNLSEDSNHHREVPSAKKVNKNGKDKGKNLILIKSLLTKETLQQQEEIFIIDEITSKMKDRKQKKEIAEECKRLPTRCTTRILRTLAKAQKWKEICFLYGQFKETSVNLMFAVDLKISDCLFSTYLLIEEEEETLIEILKILISSGANSVFEEEEEGQVVMNCLIENNRHAACYFLLKEGIHPKYYSKDGMAPVFFATQVALENGNCDILKFLLETHKKHKKKYHYLDPSIPDKDGRSLFHYVHVYQSKEPNNYHVRVAEILAQYNVQTSNRDADGMLPEWSDEQMRFVSTKKKKSKRRRKPKKQTTDASKNSIRDDDTVGKCIQVNGELPEERIGNEEHVGTDVLGTYSSQSDADATTNHRSVDKVKQSEEKGNLSFQADPHGIVEGPSADKTLTTYSGETVVQESWNECDRTTFTPAEENENYITEEEKPVSESEAESDSKNEIGKTDEVEELAEDLPTLDQYLLLTDKNTLEANIITGIESLSKRTLQDDNNQIKRVRKKVFQRTRISVDGKEISCDDLRDSIWQVEITQEAERALTDTKGNLSLLVREKALKEIIQLASNDILPHSAKPLKTTFKLDNPLYEAKLGSSERMIWEKVVTYSPKHNTNLSEGNSKFYSEVIRIWNIVTHKYVRDCVRKIEDIKRKSAHCVKPRKLLSSPGSEVQTNHPKLYCSANDDLNSRKDIEIEFSPPAFSKRGEYNLIKFYTFSSDVAKTAIRNKDIDTTFLFKVYEQEHAIIDLEMNSPVVLQGRSGTGKTTCCLYRLWKQFIGFWEPLIVERKYEGDKRNAADEQISTGYTPDYEVLEKTTKQDMKEQNVEIYEEELHTACKGKTDSDLDEDIEPDEELESSLEGHCFRQLFITKSQYLCQQVKGHFCRLLNGVDWAEEHAVMSRQPLPYGFCKTNEDGNDEFIVDEIQFPLFLTSRQFLLMLDASLGQPYFFDRNEDLSLENPGILMSDGIGVMTLPLVERTTEGILVKLYRDEVLKYDIPGWSYDLSMVDLDNDFFDDEETPNLGTNYNPDTNIHINVSKKPKRLKLRQVTYDVFEKKMWPKMRDKGIKSHPSMVWKEIVSFIKGSYECTSESSPGYLSKDEYNDIGLKKAPDFDKSDRDLIYDMFERYQGIKRRENLFDEMDVVRSIGLRLKDEHRDFFDFQQIYVDEAQDFTQCELSLIIKLCKCPNQMFLTGDAAQAIMHGISFRFSDLLSLFKFYDDENRRNGKLIELNLPRKTHQLRENYRSHNGVLDLASSIVDIIFEHFDETFDKLDRDVGMYPGQKPAIVECDEEELITLMKNNARDTANIEFGAHQAIIVLNDEAKESLPKQFESAIKLTIYESKGLEFDDVLIYNFFKFSKAEKQWPIVTRFLEKWLRPPTDDPLEFDSEFVSGFDLPHGKDYNPKEDRNLCTLLKQLYTAVSRARVNVWIYDSDEEQRQHMFAYFRARGLVETITKENFQERAFPKKTSRKEWSKQGDYFMKKGNFHEAARCFMQSKEASKRELALGTHKMKKAGNEQNPVQRQHLYLEASNHFLKCRCQNKTRKLQAQSLSEPTSCQCEENAITCFRRAKREDLYARLLEQRGEFQKAGEKYSLLKNPVESSRCFKLAKRYDKAVEVLNEYKMYHDARVMCKEYKEAIVHIREGDEGESQKLLHYVPEPHYTEDFFAYKEALMYYQQGKPKEMLKALKTFSDVDEAVDFLLQKDCIKEALSLFKETHSLEDACRLYTRYGRIEEAIKIAEESDNKLLLARCQLIYAKQHIRDLKGNLCLQNFPKDILENIQNNVTSLEREADKDYIGEAYLLLGTIQGRLGDIRRAFRFFSRTYPKHLAGMLECNDWIVKNSQDWNWMTVRHIILGLEDLSYVRQILQEKNTVVNTRLDNILAFYGFHKHDEDESLVEIYTAQRPFALQLISHDDLNDEILTKSKRDACLALHKYLITRGMHWDERIRRVCVEHRFSLKRCPANEYGFKCESTHCKYGHEAVSVKGYHNLVNADMWYMALDHYSNSCQSMEMLKKFQSVDCFIDDVMQMSKHREYVPVLNNIKRLFNLKFYQRRHFKELPYVPHLKSMTINYIRDCQKKIEMNDCYATSEVLMKTLFLYNLFEVQSLDKNLPINTVVDFEAHVEKELQAGRITRDSLKKEHFSAFPIRNYRSRKRVYRIKCAAHGFYDALDCLLRLDDPGEGFVKFTKFVRCLQIKSLHLLQRTDILNWMQYMLVVGLVFLAKCSRTRSIVILPEGYLTNLEFLNNVYHRSNVLFSIASGQVSSSPGLIRHWMNIFIENMIQITTCFRRNLKKSDYQSWLLFERVLEINATLVCNISLQTPGKHRSLIKIMRSLGKRIFPSKFDRENILSSICNSFTKKQMYSALNLLQKRKETVLLNFLWSSNRNFDLTVRNDIPYIDEDQLTDNEEYDPDIEEETRAAKISESEDEDVDILEVPGEIAFVTLTDHQEKIARKYIQRWYILCKFRHLRKHIIKYVTICEKNRIENLFSDVKVNKEACGLCGVEFYESGDTSTDPIHDSDAHCESEDHCIKEVKFRDFFDFYMRRVRQPAYYAEQLINKYNLTKRQPITDEIENQRRFLLRQLANVKSILQTMIEKKQWDTRNREYVAKSCDKLANTTSVVEGFIIKEKKRWREKRIANEEDQKKMKRMKERQMLLFGDTVFTEDEELNKTR